MLEASQIRAARALLSWSQPELAKASGLSLPTIVRMEGQPGPGRSSAANVQAVKRALESGGVLFLEADETNAVGAGVRLRGEGS